MRHKWTMGAGFPVWTRRCTRKGCGLEESIDLKAGAGRGPKGGMVCKYRRRDGEWRAPEGGKVPPCEGRT